MKEVSHMVDCEERRSVHRDATRDERGAAASEYALMVSGIALVVIFGAQVFGSLLTSEWTSLLSWLGV